MSVQKCSSRSLKTGSLCILMLLCVLLLVPGAVTASTPITGPTVITAPGSYYLENDIQNCTEPVAILIQCSNVVLDGKGKTIDGTDKAGSVGIRIYNAAMTLVNVVVRNVICSDWTNGVYLTDVKNSVFEKNYRDQQLELWSLGRAQYREYIQQADAPGKWI